MLLKKYMTSIFPLLFIVFRVSGAADLSYNPYPVILVHGFNSSPGATWGLQTAKKEDDSRKISTLFDSVETAKHDIKIGEDLINEYEGFNTFKRSYNDSGIGFINDRFIPHEEANSYSGFNHTFVEAYCS